MSNAEMAYPALQYAGVSKTFGRQAALSNIDLSIEAGVGTALVGVNGAGKSTLLRVTLDLIGIDSGQISIFGVSHRQPRARIPIAYLPERFVPPHYVTGREFLQTLLSLHEARFDSELALTECTALELDLQALDRPVREYSKGMIQKLGLVACVLAQRKLLLLDEPMSGLDPLAHQLCRQRLAALKDQGVSLFFSTHSLVDVGLLCERMVVVHRGQVIFNDTLSELRNQTNEDDLSRAFLQLIRH